MAKMLRSKVRCSVGSCMCCGKFEDPRAKEKVEWEKEAEESLTEEKEEES